MIDLIDFLNDRAGCRQNSRVRALRESQVFLQHIPSSPAPTGIQHCWERSAKVRGMVFLPHPNIQIDLIRTYGFWTETVSPSSAYLSRRPLCPRFARHNNPCLLPIQPFSPAQVPVCSRLRAETVAAAGQGRKTAKISVAVHELPLVALSRPARCWTDETAILEVVDCLYPHRVYLLAISDCTCADSSYVQIAHQNGLDHKHKPARRCRLACAWDRSSSRP